MEDDVSVTLNSPDAEDTPDTEEHEKEDFEQQGVQKYLDRKQYEEKNKHTIGNVMQRYVSIRLISVYITIGDDYNNGKYCRYQQSHFGSTSVQYTIRVNERIYENIR